MEQTTFVLRHVFQSEDFSTFKIHERFLRFVDFNQKTGAKITSLILNILKKDSVHNSNCRGQG